MRQGKANILVVEDDPAILDGLLDVLVFHGYSAKGTADGNDGLATALEGQYDLILLDVMLPGMDGFNVCRHLRAKRPTQPIIMITAKGSEEDVVNGFKCGADDYIPKPFSLRELMVRVEALLRRSGKAIGEGQIQWRGILFDALNLRAVAGDQVQELTRREMDIVAYLCQNHHRIVSKKELLTNVWHYADAEIETRTVDIHMAKLRKKLSLFCPEAETIETVRGEGYRLVGAL
jgi:two-component system response regulator RegX3